MKEQPIAILKNICNQEPYVSARVIAKYLGLNIHTVYKQAQRQQIPSHKFGKSRRFKLSEIEAVIQGKQS
ncbi:helix-turn-helix domain-containing protein [Geobacter pelophilus]|uniref:Helix-turn-helix domain-containing protein n=1 Tax=Geoanaerobacter pelophilus TaxID=60036 RepID=A0AAW4L044_9BACT|nr:helix-turn-helix domain-containing protein [Geoanaerobacter pelophilus]MBT0664213.1 helix-turn-helix domain-containing protein [Geoanaerobacter pelophilus]